ncbi:MAG: hypothetical protein QME07_05805 [bacterium]|nr:hypothetical protein [bacterium]
MKTIQVPMDERLLKEVTQRTKIGFKNRSVFIRVACQHFIQHLDNIKKEELYAEGYSRIPEDIDMAKVSSTIAAGLMQKEDW